MGKRNIEAHSAGAAGTDLNIGSNVEIDERLVQDLDMPNKLRYIKACEQSFHQFHGIDRTRCDRRADALAHAKEVLIGKGGRGIDTIDNGVRTSPFDRIIKSIGMNNVLGQIAQSIFNKAVPRF